MFLVSIIVNSFAVPLIVSAGVVLLDRAELSHLKFSPYLPGLLPLFPYLLVKGIPAFPPEEALEYLFFTCLVWLIAAFIVSMLDNPSYLYVWIIYISFQSFAIFLVLAPLLKQKSVLSFGPKAGIPLLVGALIVYWADAETDRVPHSALLISFFGTLLAGCLMIAIYASFFVSQLIMSIVALTLVLLSFEAFGDHFLDEPLFISLIGVVVSLWLFAEAYTQVSPYSWYLILPGILILIILRGLLFLEDGWLLYTLIILSIGLLMSGAILIEEYDGLDFIGETKSDSYRPYQR